MCKEENLKIGKSLKKRREVLRRKRLEITTKAVEVESDPKRLIEERSK